MISTYIDKCNATIQKTKSPGPTVGPIRGTWRAEVVGHFRLTTGHEFLGIGLAWLLTRFTHFAAILGWMATTCSSALDSMNVRLKTSSVGTGRLGVTSTSRHWINTGPLFR
ncbi:hypothetical protein TNCV_3616241 [Trichonephila clavipes]|nr:hypothetical protein TNCV_3616241 [Trichonephila clavipes]